jgi:transcriptional regulator with XRE-family HTH domain
MSNINYDKLFNPNNIELTEDVSEIDAILEFEEILYSISEKIINYRMNKKISQKELAEILKVNQSMISKLESGDYNPTFKQIYNISRKLDNSPGMFLDILENIILKLKNISIREYHIEIEQEKIIKDYCFNAIEKTNILEMTYKGSVGGNYNNEECTSAISNAG